MFNKLNSMDHSFVLNCANDWTYFLFVHNDKWLLNAASSKNYIAFVFSWKSVWTCEGEWESGAYEYVEHELSEHKLLVY